MKRKVLFIDRDGTIIVEPPADEQVDSMEKLEFIPGVLKALGKIAKKTEFELVMVTNQDGLGTELFPEHKFWPPHNAMLKTLEGEGVFFKEVLIDRSLPRDNADTRKPRTGLLTKYVTGDYDLKSSFVIGDRMSDMELAVNLGAKGILLGEGQSGNGLGTTIVLEAKTWDEIFEFLEGA